MYISKLIIRNFRNFENATFKFSKGVNTLIGENGSGKSNALYALQLLLDDSLSNRSSRLEENDFNRTLVNWKGHWIIIKIEFHELDSSEGSQLLRHSCEHMDGSQTGSYTFYFRPKEIKRQELFDLSQQQDKTMEDLVDILSTITIDDYEPVFTCRGLADFSDPEVYKKYVGDFENIVFPDPGLEAIDDLGTSVNTFAIQREVSCTFIKALRDVVLDLRNVRHSPLLKLLRGKATSVKNSSDITKAVKDLNNKISDIDEVREISNGIKTTLEGTVGATYAPTIDIKSELPDDIEKLMQSLTMWVGGPNDGSYQGKMHELSLGGANLIYLSLKLLEFEQKQAVDRVAHFLLVEEPEAHIHTHIQKTLFENINTERTQIIISTHSTHISASSQISRVNILAQKLNKAEVYHPSSNLEPSECQRIERYLDAVRSTLLFAKGVVLVEGDAELILIPTMFRRVFGCTLDEIGVSLINMSSATFVNIAKLFNDERIRRRCSIITDLDTSILPLNSDPAKDTDDQKKARNSEISGLQRKKELENFCKGNKWVESNYAKYTFEVDFLLEGNSWEVEPIVENIYKTASKRNKVKNNLKSSNITISGTEILKLADKVGKGWLALLISDKVNYNTYIPKYILEAIAFACNDHITTNNLFNMCRYRVEKCPKQDKDTVFKAMETQLKGLKKDSSYEANYLKMFTQVKPEDQLSKFINCFKEFSK